MQKGNTVFYHNHIQANIARLDERKDKFIHNRIQFLKEYCEPIQKKIDLIRKEIERYKIMRDTQEEVIQNEPDILSLKNQIGQYVHTKEYFNQKVNQYEQKSIELDQYNRDLRKRWYQMRRGVKSHHQDLGFSLPYMSQKRIAIDVNENRSMQSKSYILPNIHQRRIYDTESSLTQSKSSYESKKIVNIGTKIQRLKSYASTHKNDLASSHLIKQDLSPKGNQQKKRHKKEIQTLRERMTQFDRNQTLFHQCFEVRKNAVQKSVSQLQSKLIANRQQFLNVCHAISVKQTKVSFEEFNQLNCDEILTLFISFTWLNKKINAEFMAKRKLIMDFIGKLPKLDKN